MRHMSIEKIGKGREESKTVENGLRLRRGGTTNAGWVIVEVIASEFGCRRGCRQHGHKPPPWQGRS